jgi:hypothetical protein
MGGVVTTDRLAESTVRDWTVQDNVRLNNCQLTPGTRLSILGERGSFTFVRFVSRPDGRCWLDVIGGAPGVTKFRSFRPARIGKVE